MIGNTLRGDFLGRAAPLGTLARPSLNLQETARLWRQQ